MPKTTFCGKVNKVRLFNGFWQHIQIKTDTSYFNVMADRELLLILEKEERAKILLLTAVTLKDMAQAEEEPVLLRQETAEKAGMGA